MARGDDRRAAIADAALSVLAERGGRGLTHRAVDEAAGLPTGSTSYYLRTRAALLATAVERLAELDLSTLESVEGAGPRDLVVGILEGALREPGRTHSLARYELVLEGARRPEVRATIESGAVRLRERLADLFPGRPADEARSRARDLLVHMDGVILANVTRPADEQESIAELADRIERLLLS